MLRYCYPNFSFCSFFCSSVSVQLGSEVHAWYRIVRGQKPGVVLCIRNCMMDDGFPSRTLSPGTGARWCHGLCVDLGFLLSVCAVWGIALLWQGEHDYSFQPLLLSLIIDSRLLGLGMHVCRLSTWAHMCVCVCVVSAPQPADNGSFFAPLFPCFCPNLRLLYP